MLKPIKVIIHDFPKYIKEYIYINIFNFKNYLIRTTIRLNVRDALFKLFGFHAKAKTRMKIIGKINNIVFTWNQRALARIRQTVTSTAKLNFHPHFINHLIKLHIFSKIYDKLFKFKNYLTRTTLRLRIRDGSSKLFGFRNNAKIKFINKDNIYNNIFGFYQNAIAKIKQTSRFGIGIISNINTIDNLIKITQKAKVKSKFGNRVYLDPNKYSIGVPSKLGELDGETLGTLDEIAMDKISITEVDS